MSFYDFFKDQGSALGASATLLAVVVALFIASRTRTDAQRQIRALKDQINQTEALEKERNAARQRDLIRALGIEAARIRLLSDDRLAVARPQNEASLRNLQQANLNFYEAFRIHTTGLMQHASGIAQFETPLTSSIAECLASVDQLNSLLDVKIGLGRFLDWPGVINALQMVRQAADKTLTQTALAEDDLKSRSDNGSPPCGDRSFFLSGIMQTSNSAHD